MTPMKYLLVWLNFHMSIYEISANKDKAPRSGTLHFITTLTFLIKASFLLLTYHWANMLKKISKYTLNLIAENTGHPVYLMFVSGSLGDKAGQV